MSCNIFPSIFSDHHLVVLGLSSSQLPKKSAYWTFNTSLLVDCFFTDAFRRFWEKFIQSKPSYASIQLWWDNAKAQIRVFCQCYQSFSTSKNKIAVLLLETEILHLEEDLAKAQNDRKLWLLLGGKKLI